MVYELDNQAMYYDWGSKTLIQSHFNNLLPPIDVKSTLAEVWMGSHPKASSFVKINEIKKKSLLEFIQGNPVATVGEMTYRKYKGLPFLFKILAADKPLSIQVHPSKEKAIIGYNRENNNGIKINAYNRNYKDKNHKPELIYALTKFHALNGFRSFESIIYTLTKIGVFDAFPFMQSNGTAVDKVKVVFEKLFSLTEKDTKALINLVSKYSFLNDEHHIFKCINRLQRHYPNDIGVVMPIFLNIVELAPGEAMFLASGTPHAYLNGMGLELMANSDNVLRAGLTSKHIDINELIDNIEFQESHDRNIKLQPVYQDNQAFFIPPVNDFSLSILKIQNNRLNITSKSAEIVLCLKGSGVLIHKDKSHKLLEGTSLFITHKCYEYELLTDNELTISRAFQQN